MRGCTGTFAPRAPVIRLAASGENFGGNQQVTSAARAGATVETEVATMTHSFINRERLFTWESPGAAPSLRPPTDAASSTACAGPDASANMAARLDFVRGGSRSLRNPGWSVIRSPASQWVRSHLQTHRPH